VCGHSQGTHRCLAYAECGTIRWVGTFSDCAKGNKKEPGAKPEKLKTEKICLAHEVPKRMSNKRGEKKENR